LRGLLPLAALLAVWQLAGSDTSISLPPPDEWLTAIAELHAEGSLIGALAGTASTFVLALALATVAGTLTGMALGVSSRLDRAITPSLDFVATLPGAAIVPVAVLLLGTGRSTAVLIVALAVVWPVLLNTATAMRAIPAVRLEMSRTLGLSTGARWRKVVLPSLAPGILLGVRVASSMALVVTLLVDILGTGDGVGRLLVERQQHFDAPAAWGLLLLIGAFGYLSSAGLAHLERRLLRHWPRAERR
jgi:sulfonate transport system permease protein